MNKKINEMLTIDPVLIYKEEKSYCPTANINDTDFMNYYNGAGAGIAYVIIKDAKRYLVAFNYGTEILLSDFITEEVVFSNGKLCFTLPKEAVKAGHCLNDMITEIRQSLTI